MRALREVIAHANTLLRQAAEPPTFVGELASFEDPTPAKLDELIAAQKRTNELLEALCSALCGADTALESRPDSADPSIVLL
jgi:hypothetical protein